MQEMTRLVRGSRAEAAAAHFDRHSAAILGKLSESERTLLDALMEYADTAVDLERAAGSDRERPDTPVVAERPR